MMKTETEIQNTIENFKDSFPVSYQEANLIFAYYASFAGIFSPDFLYQLWLFFQDYQKNEEAKKLPLVVISDLLQSDICQEVAFELFEMDDDFVKEIKSYLPQYCTQNQIQLLYTMQDIASLTLEYAERYYKYGNRQNLYDMLYWKSIFTIKPTQAITELKEILNQTSIQNNVNRHAQIYLELAKLQAESENKQLEIDINKLPTFSYEAKHDSISIEDKYLVRAIEDRLGGHLLQGNSEQTIFGSSPENVKRIIQEAKEKKLKELRIEGEMWMTEIPTKVFELEYLESFSIGGAIIVSPDETREITKSSIKSISKKILNLKNLERLNLSYNSIEEIPEYLCELENLYLLNLSNNNIKYIPENIIKHKNLKYLILTSNPIKDIPANIYNFEGNCLPNLKTFFEQIENDKKSIFIEIPIKKRLMSLLNNNLLSNFFELTDNYIDDIRDKKIYNSLKYEYMAGSYSANYFDRLKVFISSTFSEKSYTTQYYSNDFKNISEIVLPINTKKLDLSGLLIDDTIINIAQLIEIQTLNLSRMQLTELTFFEFALNQNTKFANLEILDLSLNLFKIFNNDFLDLFPNLKELCLQDNPIQNIPPEIFNQEGNCLPALKEYFEKNTSQAFRLIQENLRTKNSSLDLSSNELVGTEPFLEILKYCIHLKSLNLAGNNLTSITFLSNLNFLTFLNLDINPIQDISPIQNLSLLEDLYLNQTQVTDLLPLKNCKRLRKLNLFLTKIKYNIDILNELYNLEELLIQFDDINELSFENYGKLKSLFIPKWSGFKKLNLKGFDNLESFEVQQSVSEVVLSGFNKLKRFNIGRGIGLDNIDFISLEGFQSLEKLDLPGKNLKRIEIKGCPSLSELILIENQISDISSLQSLTKLRKLNLHHNQIEDITILHHLKALESLNLGENQIQDISFLQDLKNLQTLDLSRNQIQDISLAFLNSLHQLNELKIKDNPIQNIPKEIFDKDENCLEEVREYLKSLAQIKNLERTLKIKLLENTLDKIMGLKESRNTYALDENNQLIALNLSWNKITSLSFLSNLTTLTHLDLGGNLIADLRPLESLVNLKFLILARNQIKDITPLKNLRKLEIIYLDVNRISHFPDDFLSNLIHLREIYLKDNRIRNIPSEYYDVVKNCFVFLTEFFLINQQLQDSQQKPYFLIPINGIGSEIQVSTLTSGTLGVYVYDSQGNLCVLTCSHVLSPAGINNKEADVYQASTNNVIATIENHVILDPKKLNQLDAGYAKVKNLDSITSVNIIPSAFHFAGLKINSYPKKIDMLDFMKDQKKVFKIGAGTGFSEGIITGVFDSNFIINQKYNFRDVVEVSTPENSTTGFATDRDSGAIVFFEEEKQLYALGLLFSSAIGYSENNKLPPESVSYFMKIESILEYFGLTLA